MTLHQLEAICAIARNRYNISAAAEVLHRSQSGLSRSVKELEVELGAQIFLRTRNKVFGLTPQGERLLRIGQRILHDVKNMEQVAGEGQVDNVGDIRIATNHVHARYLLPDVVKTFTRAFPRITLALQQCDPAQCRDLIASGEADVGISTTSAKPTDSIVTIPAYRLPRCVVVPQGHPLIHEKRLTLKKLAKFRLIGNHAPYIGRSIIEEAFSQEGLKPEIACSVTDTDVCKTYVEIGLGIAVLATVAFNPKIDRGLVALDANHLFRSSILNVVLRRHGFLNRSLESFLSVFAPHVPRSLLQKALDGADINADLLSQRAPVAVQQPKF
jgi:LysR family transcriptional regulator, cys regulon transcriptional activator